ncbi:response regulator [Flectobacillus major]|jgi:CheY-like chemotaxis protein|uniref:response regulator n=1 Tax=Flectobacillus major TaxID=103 RepID=UPI00041871F6|nr:response regulator [Flectobacillus major]
MKPVETICVIDDDNIYGFWVKKLLVSKNFCKSLIIFENGLTGFNYLKELDTTNDVIPDLILLDINMPIMDGWEFLEEYANIKGKFEKEIPIYVVSSSINPSDIEKANSFEEVFGFITKPLTFDNLKQIKLFQE